MRVATLSVTMIGRYTDSLGALPGDHWSGGTMAPSDGSATSTTSGSTRNGEFEDCVEGVDDYLMMRRITRTST
jgi:hypothetical protein